METPLSMRRVTRSQARSASHKKASSRSRTSGNNDRSVFHDITNDSPINGVAKEKSTFSSVKQNGALPKKTPGSGEALLRGQVKILLEKVEEGAEVFNKLSNRQSAPISPGLLAAPANTPQFNLAEVNRVAESVENEKSAEFQECVLLNRGPLVHLFNSPNESDEFEGDTNDDHEEKEEDDADDDKEGDGGENKEYLDELCEGLRKITVEDKEAKQTKFTGKHTRFIYNSEDEIEGEEEIGAPKAQSPSVVLLKGLPVPEGKHLRFNEEEDEE